MTDERLDRLYALLPAVLQMRDADHGYPLRAWLRVIAEQVNLIEDDITRLYENWFIETADDWVVPYLGDLVGYRVVHAAGPIGAVHTESGRALNRTLIPRRDVANTVFYRRRKGTLALLPLLARDVAGWPHALAVEFYKRLAVTPSLNHLPPEVSAVADTRDSNRLLHVNSPFDTLAHTVDVHRIDSRYQRGRYNIPNVGLFIWRLAPYCVTHTEALRLDAKPTCFVFSIVGQNAPLWTRPDPAHRDPLLQHPVPITLQALSASKTDYYGPGKSLAVWIKREGAPRELVAPEQIVVADLRTWEYQPGDDDPENWIAIDPERGRMVFEEEQSRIARKVWVTYHYGFSADMGGGEYERVTSQHADYELYRVVSQPEMPDREFDTLAAALRQWREDQPCHAVIEFAESMVHTIKAALDIRLGRNQTLQIRAAPGVRAVIRLLNLDVSAMDAMKISGKPGSRFTLDGVLVMERPVTVENDVALVTIRHCTLVPGWSLQGEAEPNNPTEPSLVLINTSAQVTVTDSIIGSIFVTQNNPAMDPVTITLQDSILDATSDTRNALAVKAPGSDIAPAVLTIARSTVIGQIYTHAIELGENTIFYGAVQVARQQVGCLRFCYVHDQNSRTPRRYNCQPDLALKAVDREDSGALDEDRARARYWERLRVRPHFNSTRYGTPAYCQLAICCPDEIARGADDDSEMGAFHRLYQPQRTANLCARLEEYIPAEKDAGIFFAS